jgi:hypothetical protein
MADQLLSQADYARHRGKSRQYISRLARAGVLVLRGGKVDVDASDAVLDDRPEPVSERVAAAPLEPAPMGTTFAQARTADMVFRAKLRKLEHDVRAGKLISKDEVQVAAFHQARTLRDRVLNIADRVAAMLAAEADPVRVHQILSEEIRKASVELSSDHGGGGL